MIQVLYTSPQRSLDKRSIKIQTSGQVELPTAPESVKHVRGQIIGVYFQTVNIHTLHQEWPIALKIMIIMPHQSTKSLQQICQN